jgi:dTDP-4-amino-4,6-dideoxygalactose transaminase
VHEFGFPADLEFILEIANRRNLFVVEDAACSLGTQVNNRRLGVFGDAACFSFHPRKLITSGEGGMVLTSRQDINNFLRITRNHGLALEGNRRYSNAGYNYRMTDISASLLLPQLARLEKIVEARNCIARQYLKEIVNPNLVLPFATGGILYNWQTFPVRLKSEVDLERFLIHMNNLGVSSAKPAQFIPMEPYYTDNGSDPVHFPNANSTYFRTAAIPLFELMSAKDVTAVIEACNAF